jgi:hypothetical protein
MFIGNLPELNELFLNMMKPQPKGKTNNLNLYDFGVISTLESKNIFNLDNFTKNYTKINEIDYKLLIWKLLSSSCDLFEDLDMEFVLPFC